MRENIAKKFINDLEILGDIYGEEAVVAALEALQDKYGVRSAMMEHKIIMLEANPIAKAAGPLIPRLFGTAVYKHADQDVNIASQDAAVEIESDSIEQMMDQTNDLVAQTNDLLASITSALENSNQSLGTLDYSIDDLIAATTGKSVGAVRSGQSAYASTEKAEKDEPTVFPKEPEEERTLR